MDKYIEYFENYIKSFDLSDENLRRKKEHTYRVIKFCERIAKDLKLNARDRFLLNIIGLYHDIGRFYQYEKYQKFNDWQTLDHALLSVKVLKDNKQIEDIKEKEIIYKAIENHNKIKIEQGLSEKEKLFCNIIRDADKLDILNLIIEGHIKMNAYEEEYSDKAIQAILNGQCIYLNDYDRKVDQSLVKIGFINDIVFTFSKQYILDHQIIDKLIDIYISKNPKEKKNLERIRIKVKERLSDKNVR